MRVSQALRIVGVAAALLLLSTAVFATGTQQSSGTTASDYGPPGVWPLQNTLTITGGRNLIGGNAGKSQYDLSDNPVLKELEAKTNVHVEWQFIATPEQRSVLFASDDYPDMCASDGLWKELITSWYGDGIIRDLAPYIGKGYTPNLDKMFGANPVSYSYSQTPEGQLLALPNVNNAKFSFLEQNFMINKTWLDRLGLKMPTTISELKNVLIAFRDRDANGNGNPNDELPFGFIALDGFAQHLQSMYGWWGMPTKNGIAISNDKCYFAPIDPRFRDFVKYMADLYNEGLIDPESFTQDRSQFNAKVDNPDGELYGFIIAARGYEGTSGSDQFVSVPPMAVPGVDNPGVWVHPGWIATKYSWFMTDKAPAPEHMMAWIDQWYSLDMYLDQMYGPRDLGGLLKGDDGLWFPNPDKDTEWLWRNGFQLATYLPEGTYGTVLAMGDTQKFEKDAWDNVYAKYAAKEQWNRPEFTAAENDEVVTLKTDIETLWKSNLARWITGGGSVDAEWDGYVQQMKNMGIDRYVALHQAAHDRLIANGR